MSRVTIAQSDLGQCAGCGASIDRGETIVQTGVGIVHANCEARTTVSAVDAPALAGLLFALSDAPPVIEPRATSSDSRSDGPEPESETQRYRGQLGRVRELMSDGAHRSLTEIATATGMLETSASARLRDLRKQQFGGHVVTSRLRPDGEREYQVNLTRAGVSNDEHENAA